VSVSEGGWGGGGRGKGGWGGGGGGGGWGGGGGGEGERGGGEKGTVRVVLGGVGRLGSNISGVTESYRSQIDTVLEIHYRAQALKKPGEL